MFGLVVGKFQFPCRSPYLQLSVLPNKKVFLVSFLVGGKCGHSGMSLPCLPVTLGAWSHPAFAAVPGALQQPQALAFGRWTPGCVSSGWWCWDWIYSLPGNFMGDERLVWKVLCPAVRYVPPPWSCVWGISGKNGCWKSQAVVCSFSSKMLNSTDQTSAKELEEKFCSSIFML